MGERHFDVAIVGGGLVGASLAAALSGHGLRIALVEAVPLREPGQPSYDDRTLALSLASCRIFESIGLWPGLGDGVTPIREVQVRQRGRFGGVRIRADELGVPVLGQVVEGRVIGAAVARRLPELDDVQTRCPASLETFSQSDEGVRLTIADPDGGRTELAARLLVGADGTVSKVRAQLGLAAVEHDYGQTAVIANVTPERAHDHRAFEVFTPTGPVAMLPHVGRRCGLVWTVRSEQARQLLDWEDETFLARLQDRFGRRLGRFEVVGRRSAYPLRLLFARRQIEGRCLILGNAAHTIHPVSAQGFNLGLRDVAVLAETVRQAHAATGDAGDPDHLARYAEKRRRDHERMVTYTDGLARGFMQDFLPLNLLRDAGLLAVQLLPGLKQALARRTMGYGGAVPDLARAGSRADRT